MCIGQSIYTISDSGGPSPTGGVPFPAVEEHLLQVEFHFRQWRNISYRRSSISYRQGTISPTVEEHCWQAEFHFRQWRNISHRWSSISDSGATSPAGGALFPTAEEYLLQAGDYLTAEEHLLQADFYFREWRNISYRRSSISDRGGTSPSGRVQFLTAEEHLLQAEFYF